MVGGCQSAIWSSDLATGILQALEGLLYNNWHGSSDADRGIGEDLAYRRGDFVHKVAIWTAQLY